MPGSRHPLDEAARKDFAEQVGHVYRYNPAVVLMRKLLSNGVLEEPFDFRF